MNQCIYKPLEYISSVNTGYIPQTKGTTQKQPQRAYNQSQDNTAQKQNLHKEFPVNPKPHI
jgi:hypothetical protein